LLAEGKAISADTVKALVTSAARIDVPDLAPSTVDLGAYDALLAEVGT